MFPGREKRDKPEQDDDDENSFETPTMSFESFLTYDEPTHSKKKKKLSRPSHPVTPAASVSSKSSKTNGASFKRPEPTTASVSTPTVPPTTQEKRRKVGSLGQKLSANMKQLSLLFLCKNRIRLCLSSPCLRLPLRSLMWCPLYPIFRCQQFSLTTDPCPQ